jgi:alkylhydroperoxidase family enzyme
LGLHQAVGAELLTEAQHLAPGKVPVQLVNQVYLRVSQVNGCAYCQATYLICHCE